MPTIEFEVWCECGTLLDTRDVRGGVEVDPCEKCLEAAKEEGRNEGYNERDMEVKND